MQRSFKKNNSEDGKNDLYFFFPNISVTQHESTVTLLSGIMYIFKMTSISLCESMIYVVRVKRLTVVSVLYGAACLSIAASLVHCVVCYRQHHHHCYNWMIAVLICALRWCTPPIHLPPMLNARPQRSHKIKLKTQILLINFYSNVTFEQEKNSASVNAP